MREKWKEKANNTKINIFNNVCTCLNENLFLFNFNFSAQLVACGLFVVEKGLTNMNNFAIKLNFWMVSSLSRSADEEDRLSLQSKDDPDLLSDLEKRPR